MYTNDITTKSVVEHSKKTTENVKMDLIKAEKLAKDLLEKHNPEYSFAWDNAKTRFGCCHHTNKKISLSKHLVLRNSEEQVRDTI